MNPVWANEIYIGTSLSGSTWTYSKLCAGIESINPASNEQNQQYFFLCQNGFATNVVTGMAPEYAISGRRIEGDAAQDYIVGKNFEMGDERKTSVKIISGGKQIVCDATICDIVTLGGSTLDVNQFACTLRLNGAPTVTANP